MKSRIKIYVDGKLPMKAHIKSLTNGKVPMESHIKFFATSQNLKEPW